MNKKESTFITEETNDNFNIDENDKSEVIFADNNKELGSIIKDSLEDKEWFKKGLPNRLLTKKNFDDYEGIIKEIQKNQKEII